MGSQIPKKSGTTEVWEGQGYSWALRDPRALSPLVPTQFQSFLPQLAFLHSPTLTQRHRVEIPRERL